MGGTGAFLREGPTYRNTEQEREGQGPVAVHRGPESICYPMRARQGQDPVDGLSPGRGDGGVFRRVPAAVSCCHGE